MDDLEFVAEALSSVTDCKVITKNHPEAKNATQELTLEKYTSSTMKASTVTEDDEDIQEINAGNFDSDAWFEGFAPTLKTVLYAALAGGMLGGPFGVVLGLGLGLGLLGRYIISSAKRRNNRECTIFVNVPNGRAFAVTVNLYDDTVVDIKKKIEERKGIPVKDQRLVFGGRDLANGRELSSYGVQNGDTLNVIFRLRGGQDELLLLSEDLLDPEFHFDFTDLRDDGTVFQRGNKIYKRPYGWKRYALKVTDKYPDTTWLGGQGRSSETAAADGEWPVSYHGTKRNFVKDIAKMGYKLGGNGTGIYSTPDIYLAEAERYAGTFEAKDGSLYKVILQNRIDMSDTREVEIDYSSLMTGFLSLFSSRWSGGLFQWNHKGTYYVTENPENVRAYGLLVKKVG